MPGAERPGAGRRDHAPLAATRIVFMSGYSENALLRDGRLDSGVMLLAKPHPSKPTSPRSSATRWAAAERNRFGSAVHGQA